MFSKRSYLDRHGGGRPFIRRVSMQIAGNPASRSPACSHGDSGPASSPTRVIVKPVAASHPNQVIRVRDGLTFGDDDPVFIDDTDSRLLQRDIQAREILHENLLNLTRPDCRAYQYSGGRGDDRNHPIFMLHDIRTPGTRFLDHRDAIASGDTDRERVAAPAAIPSNGNWSGTNLRSGTPQRGYLVPAGLF
jgi:hypothetical protein